jgi:regulatory protein
LARKLAPFAESQAAVEATLDLLLSRKQQSDERFASERARVLSRKYGSARVVHDLKSKGVSEEVAARVVAEADDLSKAREIISRKFKNPATNREEHAERARFLQGRGFSYDVILKVLKEIDA